jgi:hypothetical protein
LKLKSFLLFLDLLLLLDLFSQLTVVVRILLFAFLLIFLDVGNQTEGLPFQQTARDFLVRNLGVLLIDLMLQFLAVGNFSFLTTILPV